MGILELGIVVTVVGIVVGVFGIAFHAVTSDYIRSRMGAGFLFSFRQLRFYLWWWPKCKCFKRHTWNHIDDGGISLRNRKRCWVCGQYKCSVTRCHKWIEPPRIDRQDIDEDNRIYYLYTFQCEQCPEEVQKKQYLIYE